ncbi:MAG TPA: septal ring lytic transglycosylase RlpA family protein [Methylobacterium sp.]|jgi:rare lipoprotein A
MIIKPIRIAAAVLGTVTTLTALAGPAAAQSGAASWYASGSRTANGERFNPNGMTAAHRSLPFGTRVRVHNTGTGRSVVVRINDRGPFVHGRIIDLARGSARALGMGGVARVALSVVD